MNKKPGFQVKLGGEEIMYIVILVLVFGFILFMPNIYKLISKAKTGNLFNKKDTPIVENNNQNNENSNANIENDGTTLVCTKMDSTADGNFVDEYIFYYENNKLQKIENKKNYDAISDEYLNYAYSKQSLFDGMNKLYKDVPGFSYNLVSEARTLTATFLYDLNLLNPENLYSNDDDLSIYLYVTQDYDIEETKNVYESKEYNCR